MYFAVSGSGDSPCCKSVLQVAASAGNVSISVACDINLNIFEDVQMSSAAAIANCFHKASIVEVKMAVIQVWCSGSD